MFRNKILIRALMATALLMFAIPVVASAQIYDRYRHDRGDQYDLRNAIVQLENSSARLEDNLSATRATRGRRVLGFMWVANDNSAAVAEIRDFRRAVRESGRLVDSDPPEVHRATAIAGEVYIPAIGRP